MFPLSKDREHAKRKTVTNAFLISYLTSQEDYYIMSESTIKVCMEIEGANKPVTIELYEDVAPITVKNFTDLIRKGFYNGLTFHRIIKGFMIQGGDPSGNGTGGSGKNIKGEFAQNGVPNQLKHTRGVLSMARANDPNSASSQFFIMHKDSPHLDGMYAAFGKVVDGMETIDRIAETNVDPYDRPLAPQIIKSMKLI